MFGGENCRKCTVFECDELRQQGSYHSRKTSALLEERLSPSPIPNLLLPQHSHFAFLLLAMATGGGHALLIPHPPPQRSSGSDASSAPPKNLPTLNFSRLRQQLDELQKVAQMRIELWHSAMLHLLSSTAALRAAVCIRQSPRYQLTTGSLLRSRRSVVA
jgi:hypothetical protein